jgi:hypothetical protein
MQEEICLIDMYPRSAGWNLQSISNDPGHESGAVNW